MVKHNLVSFHLVERESNQQNLVTWTYPTIADQTANYLKARCFPPQVANDELFFYLRKNNLWIYIKQFVFAEKLTAFIMITEEFLPDKYKVLCDVFVNKYIKTKSPVELVKLYVHLISGASVPYQEIGSEISLTGNIFNKKMGVKELIKEFGLEIVLLYNAILLKRRILVYHPDIEKLQEKMVPMTYLVTVRNLSEHILPWIESAGELKIPSFYLAGTTDQTVLKNDRHYDILVNLPNSEIKVSKIAKDCFLMAKVHKDLAHFLVELSESDLSDARIIEQIQDKTNDIIQQLYSLAIQRGEKKVVTLTELKSKKYNQALENFLFNLAIAENIMML